MASSFESSEMSQIDIIAITGEAEPYQCLGCGDKLRDNYSLNKHIKRDTRHVSLICDACLQTRVFGNSCEFIYHYLDHKLKGEQCYIWRGTLLSQGNVPEEHTNSVQELPKFKADWGGNQTTTTVNQDITFPLMNRGVSTPLMITPISSPQRNRGVSTPMMVTPTLSPQRNIGVSTPMITPTSFPQWNSGVSTPMMISPTSSPQRNRATSTMKDRDASTMMNTAPSMAGINRAASTMMNTAPSTVRISRAASTMMNTVPSTGRISRADSTMMNTAPSTARMSTAASTMMNTASSLVRLNRVASTIWNTAPSMRRINRAASSSYVGRKRQRIAKNEDDDVIVID